MTLVNQSSLTGPYLTLSAKAAPDRTAPDGTVRDGTVRDGTVRDGTVQAGTVRASTVQLPNVHQLKVTLRDVRPPVWRRLVVPSSYTLHELNYILLDAFGWDGSHLHGFQVGNVDYGPSALLDGPSGGFGRDLRDESASTVQQVIPRAGDSMEYTYDFGDDWRHRIEVEQVMAAEPNLTYPTCLEGRGLPPEEDTGETRPGKFDKAAALSLGRALGEDYGVPGRDLPMPSPALAQDQVFAGLFPSLDSELPGLCTCGEVHDDEDSAPVFRPYLPVEPAVLAAAAADSGLVAQAVALARWVGEGRALTPSRLLRPAEALQAVAELDLNDQAQTQGRKLRSAKSLPELHCLWSAALSAGLIEIQGTRAGTGANLNLWRGQSADLEVSDLAQARLENWAALFAGSMRGRSETEEIFFPIYDEQLTAIGAQTYYATDGEPVPSALPALTLLAEGDTSPFAALPLFAVTPSPTGTLTTDWIRAGVLAPHDAPGDLNAILPIDALLESIGGSAGLSATTELALRPIMQAIRESPIVQLTQLGDYGLRRILVAHGFHIPQIGDLRDLAPEELLTQLAEYQPVQALTEAQLWLEARGEQWQGELETVIASTRTDDPVEGPVRRTVLHVVLVAAGPRVAPILDLLDQDDWLASTAAFTRHTLDLAAEPSLALQLWREVDVLSMILHDEDDEDLAELIDDSDLVELLQRPTAVAAAVTLKHPRARETLSLVAEMSSDTAMAGRLRRALNALSGQPAGATRPSTNSRKQGNRGKRKR